ncbi:hypothetical protein A3G67_02015 [Candidatus Roizmanbacteria bacterium RIFCSPLOWO2_12_FULL_40_12]|uniref:Glycosyltransferase 2-like domain-containing protein n=1 Tax=Candidatus Roizmanbacteria bacterium RIFCSPLOWO2_01_FULL_40_42 TaxID=1802066 RepID=A0A1F7J3K2_9BACT|nr:MAG: hypothetical protein A2779_01135 [Candidatus Roizmanbacteria bacterium RIFCSPHIGHO2_01_FULL_40_98]OGK28971.1 MAG: hypothetical protein A3C31_01775 [Candidatus Roizmanbacteria bacterium RIFCSPHIGHO2_02_FULL_40_53]OGK29563.1 MAG: hypothetical protein A2W49_03765 [Candidatus Roizmanbacteria bacterium RIFCSPHIGHO2_12_41_18]OGK37258.1 MAG: hypothetical protein A3E69_04075 [Candidatus Roizmanbacteria bacterium RIFCSPHIGHO2_12_FULL_40_130]OGK50200.1 MAG: hypothetical protein A3B50_00230 [Candi
MKISLIIPCYNEESNLQKGVLDKIGRYAQNDSRFIEVLVVDDGSTDRSKNIVKKFYLPGYSKFKLIENPHRGKAFAVITGIKEAKGKYIIFSDIDLATPIEEAEKLIEQLGEGSKIVIGSRSSQRKGAPFLRKLMAVGLIMVRGLFIGLGNIKDTQCGFKAFERKTALKIIDKLQVFNPERKTKGSSVSAGFDLEFLFLAKRLGLTIKEVPVTWRHVETKNVNFIKDSLETLKDLLKIKTNHLMGKYK